MKRSIVCTAIRPSTGSIIEVELPDAIIEQYATSNFHTLLRLEGQTVACEWIGQEFNWQFIPQKFTGRISETKE